MAKDLPVLGAALSLDMFAHHRDWILADQRDLELQSFCWPNSSDADLRKMVARAKELLDGYEGRLGLHGPFTSFNIDCADPEIIEVIRTRMLRVLEITAELGGDQMVIHSPYSLWKETDLQQNPAIGFIQVERVRYVLTPVIDRAEELGVTLVIENVEDITPGLRVDLAAKMKSKAVKVSLDTGHAQFMHRRCGAPPVDVFVHAAGTALQHVHLQDIDGYGDRHWHPGEGTIAWHSVFTALNKLPEMPRLILEVNDEVGLRKGADYLASLGLAR
ncbi:sugar phosphate isomerase [Thioclava sp. L04-15]|uniref:sugar phosphate isomerase/epimerase family protein n=1 Tax=Thioclava sp. L04-15 TaxID=1915318 RepID=UPI000998184F|nr:sugar phosphate isomerase/epimerase family protein [Thioclava sp. L04-15]OOY29747.1 sugar phosphate isomerase [Thioclava sp. L04-15]TNE84931.1 MAG: sugar phosphate isomerase/epimerase [Paracoccaceae bacterium]